MRVIPTKLNEIANILILITVWQMVSSIYLVRLICMLKRLINESFF